MKTIEYGVAFALGAFIYTLLEIIWRGYTHWTMTLTGGVCLAVIFMWSELMHESPSPLKWFLGALSITVIEFAVGCVVNLWLKQRVWDYSTMRFNVLGQVCFPFAALWYVISIPAFYLCDVIKKIV